MGVMKRMMLNGQRATTQLIPDLGQEEDPNVPSTFARRLQGVISGLKAHGVFVLNARWNRPEVTEDDQKALIRELDKRRGQPFFYIERQSYVQRERQKRCIVRFGITKGYHTRAARYKQRLEALHELILATFKASYLTIKGNVANGWLEVADASTETRSGHSDEPYVGKVTKPPSESMRAIVNAERAENEPVGG